MQLMILILIILHLHIALFCYLMNIMICSCVFFRLIFIVVDHTTQLIVNIQEQNTVGSLYCCLMSETSHKSIWSFIWHLLQHILLPNAHAGPPRFIYIDLVTSN